MQNHTLAPNQNALTLHLVGLGDVGVTLLTGLMLLGEEIREIGIYDPDVNRMQRCEQEMNQILPSRGSRARVVMLSPEQLFDGCDAFLFTASAGVPPIGSGVTDVRTAQYEKNKSILRPYAELAVRKKYTGLFFQVSDPVDRLCHIVADAGVPEERIIGCGLGVMLARADYCARNRGISDFLSHGRVYGPHGEGLIVANAIGDGYDEALSAALSQEVLTANLAVRDTGYKPYIAPGLSSGAITVLRALRGEWFDGSIALDGIFFGCRSRLTPAGIETEPFSTNPMLQKRMEATMEVLRAWRNG